MDETEEVLKELDQLYEQAQEEGDEELLAALKKHYPRIRKYIRALQRVVRVFWKEVDQAGVGFEDTSYHNLDKGKIDRAFSQVPIQCYRGLRN